MAVDQNQERHQAHALLDLLPAEQLSAIRGLMETMVVSGDRTNEGAPLEPEETSDDEERAVAEAKEWIRTGGKNVSHEEVLADFGLTTDDFAAMARKARERRSQR